MQLLSRAGLAAAAVGAAFVAGLSVNGDTYEPVVSDPVRLVNADLRPATSCDALLGWYVDHGLQRVTPWGWDISRIYTLEDSAAAPGDARTAAAPAPGPAPASGTGTNVQESGVDEPDIVKTDGRLLVRIDRDGSLAVYDVSGAEPVLLGSLALPGVESPELLLAGDRVVVVGRTPYVAPGRVGQGTEVLVVSIADPSAPTMVRTSTYDSAYVTARQHGDVVRLVVSTALPQLDFVQPGMVRTEGVAQRKNEDVVRTSTIDDWLPHVTTTDSEGRTTTSRVADCADVSIPSHDAGLGTVAVVGFDVTTPETTDVTAVTTPSETVYASLDHLYLASSSYRLGWQTCCWDVRQPEIAAPSSGEDDGTTYLYDFDLDGIATTYAASGSVLGTIADRWSMDESGGVLRVAVEPTTRADLGNVVVTLSRSGSDLVELGRVEGLGVGEQIKAMRWFDGLAVMVTFRQTDPFYAIDLTDPASPRLLGELKLPGYSSYLHPLGDHRMIGIGSAADPVTGMVSGAKASLFDVHDVTAPRELDTVDYGPGTAAQAELDPRQFTWLPDGRTALTVIANWNTGSAFVSVLRIDDSTITERDVPLDLGDDVSRVRLVPLPDGRVLLSTATGVSFFAV
ncbi:MAG: beta-propeller domain-containing protein [Nocardioides sp.]